MPYTGVIIAESLHDPSVLQDMTIISTKIEPVTERHHTPHIEQWTLHTVEIPDERAGEIAERISQSLDGAHGEWYADFKNDTTHYIIFRGNVFVIDRTSQAQYDEAKAYGISLGIPDYQVDFKVTTET